MSSVPLAELSSISAALDDLSKRIGKLAEDLTDNGNNDVAFELFEVERSLSPGQRRLTRLLNKRS